MGGLVLAPGLTHKGYFHNLAAPPKTRIPEGVIDEDAWVRENYRPGDVVVIHPHTPHVGLPNRSNRVRFSIDTRVQSTANPAVIVGEVTAFDVDSVPLRLDAGKVVTLKMDDETFIRTIHFGERISRETFVEKTEPGLRVVASRDGYRVMMLRKPTAG